MGLIESQFLNRNLPDSGSSFFNPFIKQVDKLVNELNCYETRKISNNIKVISDSIVNENDRLFHLIKLFHILNFFRIIAEKNRDTMLACYISSVYTTLFTVVNTYKQSKIPHTFDGGGK